MEPRERIHREPGHQTVNAPRRNPMGKVSFILSAVIAFSVAWMVARTNAQIYGLNYHNVHLQMQIQKLSAQNASLTSEVDTLSAPSRILSKAMQDHMQYANPIQIGFVSTGK